MTGSPQPVMKLPTAEGSLASRGFPPAATRTQSSPRHTNTVRLHSFQYYCSIYPFALQVLAILRASISQLCKHFCAPPCLPNVPSNSSWLRHPNHTNHNASSSPLFTSSHSGPNILLSTLFSNTHNVCTSLNVTDQVAHPCQTTGNITTVRYSTSQFLYSKSNGEQ